MITLLVVGTGAFFGYRYLFPPDEARIRRLLVRTAESASIEPRESLVKKLASVNRVLEACAEDVEVVLEGAPIRSRSIRGRDELREILAALRGSNESVAIELLDIGVEVAEDRSGATAQFLARARVSGVEEELIQEFRVVLIPLEGEWKIRRVEPLTSLQMEL